MLNIAQSSSATRTQTECPLCGQNNPSGGDDPLGNLLCINCYATAQFSCGICKRDLGLDHVGDAVRLHCLDCCEGHTIDMALNE